MPASLFGIILAVTVVATAVLGFSSFSVYVLGAENPTTMMWGWKTYASIERGFSVKHPEDFSVDQEYAYKGLGKNRTIRGVSFVPNETYTAGTNLSSLTKLSVETVPNVTSCAPDKFLYKPQARQSLTEEGKKYDFAMEREVKRGVVREERVYTLSDSSPCVAVRYTVYSALIQVDDPAAVKPFDEQKLLQTFDTLRHSLSLMNK